MKKLIHIIVLLTLAAIALCACSRETPLQRALSTIKSEFGIDLKNESITVERLAYTYDDGNIFGEGFAAYKIGFTQDASAHFAGLDTTPDINADDGIVGMRRIGQRAEDVEDGAGSESGTYRHHVFHGSVVELSKAECKPCADKEFGRLFGVRGDIKSQGGQQIRGAGFRRNGTIAVFGDE